MRNFLFKLTSIDNKWFFSELPFPLKFLSFFIRGDLIILFPLVILILNLGFLSIRFMVVMIGVYITVRNLGEMIYWFSHQFHERSYRPYDFGFKNLDNHAIYILYQTLSIVGVVLGMGVVIYFLVFTPGTT